jgi:hypothetical protein
MNPWLRWWCPTPYWTPETLREPKNKTAWELAAEEARANGFSEPPGGMLDV